MFHALLATDLAADNQTSKATLLAGLFSTVVGTELENCVVCAVLARTVGVPGAGRKRRSWDALVRLATTDITTILTPARALCLFTNLVTLLVARVAEMDADMAECSTVLDLIYDEHGVASRPR